MILEEKCMRTHTFAADNILLCSRGNMFFCLFVFFKPACEVKSGDQRLLFWFCVDCCVVEPVELKQCRSIQ